MIGIVGPCFVKGAAVQRTDNSEHGTLLDDQFYDYVAVKWSDGSTSWIRRALLRLVERPMT